MELTIECEKRDPKAKAKALRRDGLMPVVLYGHDKANSLSLTAKQRDMDTLLRQASENNTLVRVQIPDGSYKGKALIREIQRHPWRNMVYHVSFFAVSASDMVEVTVSLNYVGEPVGVENGGVLNTEINELTVKCQADSIPESIDVDVSGLDIGSSLTLGDLKLPAGVEATGEPDQALATVLAGRMSAPAEGSEEDAGAAPLEDAVEA